MKLYRICGIGAFALALGLVACGDDSGSNSGTNGVKGEVIALADGSGEKVCDDKLEGWVAEAVGKDFRRCQNGEWTKITASEASAEDEIIGGVTVLQSSSSEVIPSEVEGSSSSVVSSSSVESSSSVVSSSSSSVILSGGSAGVEGSSSSKANWVYLNPNIDYGEFTDERDGQVYKTVSIGTQTWMAENLNYAYTGVKYNYDDNTTDSTSWCYENKASNCDKYGRLYTWSAVMDSAAQFSVNAGTRCGYGKTCTPNSPHRGICPEGWHVPTNEEYSTLYTYIGGSNTAGPLLKSTSGWNDYNGWSGNGIDKYGFSVLPAGQRSNNGDFYSEGSNAGLWSASEYDSSYAWSHGCNFVNGYAGQHDVSKNFGQSLRCLKD